MSDSFRGYAKLLRQIKQRVLLAQQRAIYAANEEMLRMYWDIGGMLQQSQEADGWGKKTLQRLAVDLKNDYPEIKGFSVRNMQCMMQFFNEYNQELTMVKGTVPSITQPVVAQPDKDSKPITQSLIAQSCKYNFTLPVKHLNWTHSVSDSFHFDTPSLLHSCVAVCKSRIKQRKPPVVSQPGRLHSLTNQL